MISLFKVVLLMAFGAACKSTEVVVVADLVQAPPMVDLMVDLEVIEVPKPDVVEDVESSESFWIPSELRAAKPLRKATGSKSRPPASDPKQP